MKILILANHDLGLYKFRKELLETLVKDNEVFVSLPIGKFTKKIKDIGCKYIETNFDRKGTSIFGDLKLLSTYRNILKDIKPDAVLTYTIKPNVYGGLACQSLKIPYIVNVTGLGSAIENGGLLSFISTTLYRIGLRKANKIFFQNEANRNFMQSKGIGKNNSEIIPGSGVNLNQYKTFTFPKDDSIEFTYVGRIMKEKGFDQYADAAKYIRNKYPNTVFHVCGPYEDDYKQIVEELVKDNVLTYDGYVEDMTTIYKKVQCTVHPTYYPEGLSNVLLETCACGRPIITTDRPGCKEVVEDGFNGYIIKQKDSEDLISKLEMFLSLTNKQRKQMGLNARTKVEKEFDRNIVIDKYVKAINEVTNAR